MRADELAAARRTLAAERSADAAAERLLGARAGRRVPGQDAGGRRARRARRPYVTATPTSATILPQHRRGAHRPAAAAAQNVTIP